MMGNWLKQLQYQDSDRFYYMGNSKIARPLGYSYYRLELLAMSYGIQLVTLFKYFKMYLRA